MKLVPKPKPFLSPTFPLICLFLILLSCFSSSTLADDTSTMQKLAASLSGTPNAWSNDKNPCTWSGIKCDSSNRVTSINLSKQRLSGTLPSDLTQLSSLQSFNVQQNTISGPLPLFSNLTNLQQLLLNDNNFTSVPSSSTFMGLSALQTLNLGDNPSLDPWFFPQDLTQSNTLTAFTANNVNLMGTIPDIFDKFPSLQSLRLSYNNLTGSLPPSFGVTGIQNLWLNNQLTGLSGTLDVLSKMNQLTQVWLQKNDFTGPIPDLSNCTSLFDLQLRDNQLTGLVPPSLTTLASLLNLTLSNNKLQGPLPSFGSRVKLILTPTNNFCTTQPGVPCDPQVMTLLEIAAALGYPFNLANSWLGNNACQQWTYVTCDSQHKNVTVVNFSKQNFLGTISPAFSKLASLRSLLLDHNHLTGPIPDSLTHLTQLKMLDVSNNNLSGKVPDFPPGVTLNTVDNPLLGKELPSGGNSGGDGNTDSDPKSLGKKPTSVSVALIVGIVIAVVVFICILLWVFYKSYTKKHPEKFGRVSKDTQNGKGMTTNTSVAGSNMNAYGGVPNELNSQSSGEHSDVQFFEGGNVAISFQVLRQVTNNFSEDNILGRGGFGVVYKGELHDGTQIAVKRMESGVMGTKGLKEFQAEIAVLTKVRHRHLVALLGFCTNGNERLLVYEYMPQGTLSQHLFEWRELGCNPLTWKQRVSIALDVARGIEYLHSLAQQSFIHRDLKPSNILLGDDMRAKVADFGLVKNAPDGKYSVETKLAGTFGYLAPEYAVTGRVTTKVDVYAFGVVLMELLTGRKALDEALPDEMSHLVSWFRRVLTSKKDIIKSIDPTLDPDEETFEIICRVAELAGHCTSREPSQRPDMGHAVNILGPLVEQWKPTTEDLDDSFGIDFHVSLPQALQRWQANEGTSTMAEGLHHGRTTSISDTQSSIPTKPGSFADTMDSMDCR